MIPLVNLEKQYARIRTQVLARIEEVLESRAFIQGRYVGEFEREWAAMNGAPHAVGCSNGTSAISLALAALGVGPDDEVITVPNTFIATAEAIIEVGARPVFVDVDPATHQLNTGLLEQAITANTRAIIPVHLYGNLVDMDPLLQVASQFSISVVEDTAQAHLATYKGRFAGTMGDAGTFSFYPGKNLGAIGDAGAVFCRQAAHDQTVRKLLDHGRLSKYEHDLVGLNNRMDAIQAVVLQVKLAHIEEWTQARRATAAAYRDRIDSQCATAMAETPDSQPAYHLMVVEVANRDEVIAHMSAEGIATGIHYPLPLHLQPALASLGYTRGDFPVAEAAAERVLSLPMCPELELHEVEMIAGELNSVAHAS